MTNVALAVPGSQQGGYIIPTVSCAPFDKRTTTYILKLSISTLSMTLQGSTKNADNSRTGNAALVIYNVLQISGVVSLSVIPATAWFSPAVKRSPAWFVLIFSGLLFGVSGLLIIGRQTDIAPSRPLCCAQAIIAYPATML